MSTAIAHFINDERIARALGGAGNRVAFEAPRGGEHRMHAIDTVFDADVGAAIDRAFARAALPGRDTEEMRCEPIQSC